MVNLSIFNFNKVFNIIGIFVGIFIVYNIYIVVQKPKITMFQNQSQGNYIFAQDFLYGNKAKNLIVGSSMAARMKQDFLPVDYYNLSFGGGGVLTGLEIIRRSGFIPNHIYIENNIIFRNRDNNIINSLFYPILWKVKSFIPALKEKYQPLNLIISKLRGSYGKTHEELMKDKRDENIYKSSLNRQKEFYDKPLDNYQKELTQLKYLVNYFESEGSRIIFFEMPIENILSNSIRAKEQRKVIKENFQNEWFELPQNDKYLTSDGIHLLYNSAYMFSKLFNKNISSK